eukprot:13971840-Alexandrium_andersonii.AAC.1
MSASLVGSEMCIRDSLPPLSPPPRLALLQPPVVAAQDARLFSLPLPLSPSLSPLSPSLPASWAPARNAR